MRQYNYNHEWKKLLTPEIVKQLTYIHELKSKQNFITNDSFKEELSNLIELAKIQSTEASNKIEGIYTSDERLKKLVLQKTNPSNRNESEIAGYRDVLNTVHKNYEYIPVTPNYILQLYRDLNKFSATENGSGFKVSDNIISETSDEGIKITRFVPVPAWETPLAVDEICKAYSEAQKDINIDLLIIVPMFILDFLCIHPFADGNGRMSRILTLLLLYRAGYDVGKYVSLEKIVEQTKETYYEALKASSFKWHENKNDYSPFVEYMLGVIINAYKEFDERTSLIINKKTRKTERIAETIKQHLGVITKAEIILKCPDISETTIQRTLASLVKTGDIKKVGGGRYTKYVWNGEK